jgi:predicted dehydrogenase
MKVGIVGCGKIASSVHLPSIQKLEGYDLVAAADIDEVSLQYVKERFNINEIYKDYRQMLAKADIEAVFVCTPPAYHFQVVMDAIEWGKHVFCEKPLATTVDDALAIKQALNIKRNKPPKTLYLMPAHNFIFTPCFNEALKLIENGEIGKIQKIKGFSATNLQFYKAKTDFRKQAKCDLTWWVKKAKYEWIFYEHLTICNWSKKVRLQTLTWKEDYVNTWMFSDPSIRHTQKSTPNFWNV